MTNLRLAFFLDICSLIDNCFDFRKDTFGKIIALKNMRVVSQVIFLHFNLGNLQFFYE